MYAQSSIGNILSSYNETFVFLSILCLFLLIYKSFLKRPTKSYNLPPRLIGLPVFGYLPFLGRKPYKTLQKLSKKYGNIFSTKCGQKLIVFCNDWSSAEEAFGKIESTNRPDGIFDAIPNGLGYGILNGKEWRDSRKFAVKIMKDVGLGGTRWEPLLQEEIGEIVKSIQDHKGELLDIRQILSFTFTNDMLALLFGHRLPLNHPSTVYISNLVDSMIENFPVLSLANFLPRLCSILYLLGLYGSKKTLQEIKDFGIFVKNYIDKELRQGIEGDNFVNIYLREFENLKTNQKMLETRNSLYGDVQLILLAGTESSRAALVWLSVAMAKYPKVQEKIHKELDSVLGKDGKIVWAQKTKVPYTYGAVMEILRWKTILPINSIREANADFKLQGYDIPKGTVIIVNQWAIHNDPKYWPEPHEFKPERFLEDGEKIITSKFESYMPFSLGKRNCPGKLIFLLEIFQYFIALMKNFTIMPPEGGDVDYEIVMGLTRQVKDVKLRFIPRDDSSTN